jgi:Tol biopolymer transport system component/DNA-binding winged helix-turn-helix (wHTH) protein
MLKPHRNLLEPPPSERLRIGDRIVDIPLREIAPAAGGEPFRVTLKSLGVLLALVANAGRVVSREALLEWVWPDTLPTDDVLTQAIAQLRRALGDEREHPRYIDTIAKQGYRLIAPVEWLADDHAGERAAVAATNAAAAMPAEAPHAEASPRRGRRIAIAAAVAVVLAIAAIVALPRLGDDADAPASSRAAASTDASPPLAVGMPYQRIATLPVSEERPSLSPDGALVAYTRMIEDGKGAPLMLQTSAAMPARALTEAVAGQYDLMPAWSPDGRQIAFVRQSERDCLVMSVPAAGGSPRELGECLGGEPHPVSWYPDGDALIGALRTGYSSATDVEKALHRLALDGGGWQRLRYARAAQDEDMSPAVSPDGRWIAFQRNVSLADLWRVPVAGGTPERLTHLRTNIYGLAWTPDSRHLVFSRYRDSRILLSVLDLETGQVRDHAGDVGGVLFPSVSGRGDALAFEVEDSQSVLRRVALDEGEAALRNSRVILESSGSNLLPALSPDGRQVLFVSDRTGDTRLWWQDTAQPESLRPLEGFVPFPRHPVLWHADGQRALAIGRSPGQRLGVYEIEPRRGRIRRLPVPDADPVHASYHPDPERLLVVADQGAGRLGVTLYDRSRVPWRAMARLTDVAVAVVDPRHRRIVLASASSPAIRSADLDLRDVRTVDRTANQRRNRSLVVAADGVRVMDAGACSWHWRPVNVAGPDLAGADLGGADLAGADPAGPAGHGAAGAGRCLGREDWALQGVSQSAAEPVLYVSVIERMQTDVGVAALSALLATPAANDSRPVASR